MMESISPLKKSPDKEIIEEIAIELGVDPSFIEKDWYAIRLLEAISQVTDEKFSPVFSGGTSLSKGYALIERFSEDLDFRINFAGNGSRTAFRDFRGKMYEAVTANDANLKIIEGSQRSRDSSRFFGCMIEYPKIFETPQAIRPHLQLEFTFRPSRLPPELREIRSFESQYRQNAADLEIDCIVPVETAADKLSALIWRVKDRERGGKDDDPALIRHLHDISKLKETISDRQAEFLEIIHAVFESDLKRGKETLTETLPDALQNLIAELENDKLYSDEYRDFVAAVSYADQTGQIQFGEAVNALKNILDIIKKK